MISVVIPTWNARDLLHVPLESLRAQKTDVPYEVIVVDDASTDGTAEFLARCYPEVRLVRRSRNGGFPAAVNDGFRAARGDKIALLNNDAAADEGWLAAMDAALCRAPEIGAVACRVLLYYERRLLDSAGLYYSSSGSTGAVGQYQRDGAEFQAGRYVMGAAGAAAMFRRALVDDIGFMDEDLIAYYEDTDFALRAQLAGWKTWYEPTAVVYHMGGMSYQRSSDHVGMPSEPLPVGPPRPSARVLYLVARNYPITLLKFVPLRLLLRDGWAILAFELNLLWTMARRGLLRDFIRGRLDFIRLLPRNLKKALRYRRLRRIGAEEWEALFVRPTLREYWRILLRKLGRPCR